VLRPADLWLLPSGLLCSYITYDDYQLTTIQLQMTATATSQAGPTICRRLIPTPRSEPKPDSVFGGVSIPPVAARHVGLVDAGGGAKRTMPAVIRDRLQLLPNDGLRRWLCDHSRCSTATRAISRCAACFETTPRALNEVAEQ